MTIFTLRHVSFASEENDNENIMIPDIDYSCIEKIFNQSNNTRDMSFEELVDNIQNSDYNGIKEYVKQIGIYLKNEFITWKNTLITLLTCAVISSICVSYFSGNSSKQVGQTGCYVAYIITCITMLGIYKECVMVTVDTLKSINEFMGAFIPAYVAVTAFSTGSLSATGYYSLAIVLIAAVNIIIINVIIPMSNIYMLVNISDNLLTDNHFGKMKKLVKNGADFLMKMLIVIVCGVSVIQKMILPYKDILKRQTIYSAIKTMPVISGSLSGLNDIFFASAIVLKNSVGIAAIISLLVIISFPVIKIAIGMFILKISAALTEPVTDIRISNGIDGGAKAVGILLMSVIGGVALFIISLAMAAGTGI